MHEKPLFTTSEGQEVYSTERNHTPKEMEERLKKREEEDYKLTQYAPKDEGLMMTPTQEFIKKSKVKITNFGKTVTEETFEEFEKEHEHDHEDDLPLAA